MDFRSNYISQSFQFSFYCTRTTKGFKDILVIAAPIVVMNKVSEFMSLFRIPHINKANNVYTVFQFFNFCLHSYYNFTLKPHATV